MTGVEDTVQKHRILSIDGGGIRGVIALEILAKIESDLRIQTRRNDLVLGDWFDFIGGTSTGSIIAACLAVGMSVTEIMSLYIESGQDMFRKAPWHQALWNKYKHDGLKLLLQEKLGAETTLGSDRLRALLLIVLHNVGSDSPWPVTSNPKAKFNQSEWGSENNLNIPLWALVRASTAAPTYFAPEQIHIGSKLHTFVDGGLTPYNNPAFLMFLNATLPQYNLNWSATPESLLLVSVGTGSITNIQENLLLKKMHMLYSAENAPKALINSNVAEQDKLCRIMGKCVVGDEIDSEIGDLIGTVSPLGKDAFTYLRYSHEITSRSLSDLGLQDIAVSDVDKMDRVDPSTIHLLRRIGSAIAKRKVKAEHFLDHCPYLTS